MGETPLECLERFRTDHPTYTETKMTYLGRLDPMAEGLVIVLAGDTREREKYLGLDKTYEFEVLWGFSSDTHDILGLVSGDGRTPQKLEEKMPRFIKQLLKKKTQAYPLFSSKMFGKDFLRARDVKVEMLDFPEKGIKIFSLEHLHTRSITGREILGDVSERIALVSGDFRQPQVMNSWQNTLITRPNEFFLVSKFQVDVSSGTYIRGLADELGELAGTGALAWSIKRTRVGEYKIAS